MRNARAGKAGGVGGPGQAACAMQTSIFRTSLGWAGVAITDKGVCGVVLPKRGRSTVEGELNGLRCRKQEHAISCSEKSRSDGTGMLAAAVESLRAYFAGECSMFELPLDLRRATAFQRTVWRAAATIPYAETRSYSWVAKRIGKPLAARAIGQALGANPVPVIIPCHRVVTAAGALGGFTGGIGMKRRLLDLEKNTRI